MRVSQDGKHDVGLGGAGFQGGSGIRKAKGVFWVAQPMLVYNVCVCGIHINLYLPTYLFSGEERRGEAGWWAGVAIPLAWRGDACEGEGR